MLRRKRGRLDPLDNFSFQAIRHDILDEAERGNYAEILLLKTKWELMWRMCGKPPVDAIDNGDESFLYEKRRYIKKVSTKPPAGVLDLTTDDDEDYADGDRS